MADLEFRLRGLEGIEAAMEELTTAAAKGAARRALVKAGRPLAEAMNAAAPVQSEDEGGQRLSESYIAGTKLNDAQTAARRREGKDDVEAYVGTDNPAGIQQEFGNTRHGPQPHARPAWEGGKMDVLARVEDEMAAEVDKAVQRARRKAARN